MEKIVIYGEETLAKAPITISRARTNMSVCFLWTMIRANRVPCLRDWR